MPEEWNEVRRYSNKLISYHITRMLITIVNDPEFVRFDAED